MPNWDDLLPPHIAKRVIQCEQSRAVQRALDSGATLDEISRHVYDHYTPERKQPSAMRSYFNVPGNAEQKQLNGRTVMEWWLTKREGIEHIDQTDKRGADMKDVWTSEELNRLCFEAMEGNYGKSGIIVGNVLYVVKAFLALQEKLHRSGGTVTLTPDQAATLPEFMEHTKDCVRSLAAILVETNQLEVDEFAEAYLNHLKADGLRSARS